MLTSDTRLTYPIAAAVRLLKTGLLVSPVDEFVTPLREAQSSSNTYTRQQVRYVTYVGYARGEQEVIND